MLYFDDTAVPLLRCTGEIAVQIAQGVLERVDPPGGSSVEAIGSLSGQIDSDLNVAIEASAGIRLNRSRITNTDIILAADKILPDLNNPAGARLVLQNLRIELPFKDESGSPLVIDAKEAIISSGGITTSVKLAQATDITWLPEKSKFSGTLSGSIAGFAVGLQSLGLVVVQNAIVAASGHGKLHLPFFDKPIDIEVAVAQGGGWRVSFKPGGGPLDIVGSKADDTWLALGIQSLEFITDPNGEKSLRLNTTLNLKLSGEPTRTSRSPGCASPPRANSSSPAAGCRSRSPSPSAWAHSPPSSHAWA